MALTLLPNCDELLGVYQSGVCPASLSTADLRPTQGISHEYPYLNAPSGAFAFAAKPRGERGGGARQEGLAVGERGGGVVVIRHS